MPDMLFDSWRGKTSTRAQEFAQLAATLARSLLSARRPGSSLKVGANNLNNILCGFTCRLRIPRHVVEDVIFH
jgi:hypothetical protein